MRNYVFLDLGLIHPDEGVLNELIMTKYRNEFRKNLHFAGIKVVKVANLYIAINGNHRLRAYVDLIKNGDVAVLPIYCEVTEFKINIRLDVVSRQQLKRANYFGSGVAGFSKIKTSICYSLDDFDLEREVERMRININSIKK